MPLRFVMTERVVALRSIREQDCERLVTARGIEAEQRRAIYRLRPFTLVSVGRDQDHSPHTIVILDRIIHPLQP